jgi:hypothetical protein
LEIDMGAVAINQMLLGDSSTIELFQDTSEQPQKIRGKVVKNSITGGIAGHLSTVPGNRITASNLENNIISANHINKNQITNEKLSVMDEITGLGAAVESYNISNSAITTNKLAN